jgi:hypothetical protein
VHNYNRQARIQAAAGALVGALSAAIVGSFMSNFPSDVLPDLSLSASFSAVVAGSVGAAVGAYAAIQSMSKRHACAALVDPNHFSISNKPVRVGGRAHRRRLSAHSILDYDVMQEEARGRVLALQGRLGPIDAVIAWEELFALFDDFHECNMRRRRKAFYTPKACT